MYKGSDLHAAVSSPAPLFNRQLSGVTAISKLRDQYCMGILWDAEYLKLVQLGARPVQVPFLLYYHVGPSFLLY